MPDATSRMLLCELQKIMWKNVGVLRSKQRLETALNEIRRMRTDIFPNLRPSPGTIFNTSLMDWFDLRNSLLCAEAICHAANQRKESRGAHQMEDMPFQSDEFTKNQIISTNAGKIVSRWRPVQKLKFRLEKKCLAQV